MPIVLQNYKQIFPEQNVNIIMTEPQLILKLFVKSISFRAVLIST